MQRPRRLRANKVIRDLVHEISISPAKLIQPYFLNAAKGAEPISGFTGVSRFGEEQLLREIERDMKHGVKSFLFFGNALHRDDKASEAASDQSLIVKALKAVRAKFGKEPVLYTDVCLCPYTSHGHCGLVTNGEVDNDKSLNPLAQMSVRHAEAGADFVAPSDMMDGRIGVIRQQLDLAGHAKTGILAYTAKYASSYYGPFREALSSSPTGEGGSDRATYQMDFRNLTDAVRELDLDLQEGADMVMVKPALAYLDIIAKFRELSPVPVVAYSVSGEYEMVKALAKAGLADEAKLATENLTAIFRSGAHAVITYFASIGAEKGWFK